MSDTQKKPEELNLTSSDRALLDSMKKFQSLDKGSQNRLRMKINLRRRESEDFDSAFGYSLGSALGTSRKLQESSIFGSIADVLTHPITAMKGKIASSLLKRRNKAPEILSMPHEILQARAEEWDFETGKKKDLVEIVRKMGAALRGTSYGDKLGIAAPQIGISKRIFVCQGAVCVNPTWVPPSHSEKGDSIEGCYSVPGKLYTVKRDKYGWAKWFSIDGTPREFKLKDKDAVVFQHELDHLDGKCCDSGIEFVPPSKEEPKQ